MPLSPGRRLGPYEIVAPLGKGGMGEVYRARDTRLQRDVAVKILPPEFARDADRLQRFEQESKAAAALNHPNVLAVFDVGVEAELPYVVSELLEGEALSDVLSHGPMSLRTALDTAIQVASGMAAAHDKGIIHRDLKPANIFVTTEGRTKILDFGIAKIVVPRDTDATTRLQERPSTQTGMVLGSAGYMSPEQVRGDPVDHRTDIFSFGVVLYEMLSGQPAFIGSTAVETMAAVLTRDPPALPAGTLPPAVERFVYRCLEKQPSRRFRSAGDIAYALEALSASTHSTSMEPAGAPGWRVRWRPAAVAAGMLAALAIGAAAGWRLAPVEATRLEFTPRTFDRRPITNARFMPDGRTIVFSAASRGYVPDLFVMSPGAEAPQPLGVSGAHLLSVSRTGELALIADASHVEQRLYSGTLARMTVGSSPRAIMEKVREADWAPDAEAMAVVRDLGNGRDRLDYPAGTPLYEASGYLSDPRVSPDGSRVAFFEHQWRFDDRGWVKVVDRQGAVTTLTDELWGLQGLAWTPDGDGVVFSGNTVGGAIMQPMIASAAGDGPSALLFGVPGRFIVYDVAPDGRLLAVREDLSLGVRAAVPGQAREQDLSWLGSSGARALSSDGAWLLMVDVGLRSGSDYGVVLRRTDATETIRLGVGSSQRLSPDGRWASAILATPPELVLYPTGPGDPIHLETGPIDRFDSAEWFPDGRHVFVCGSEPQRPPRCYRQALDGGPPSPLTAEGMLAWLAPDGHTLLTLQDGSFGRMPIEGGPAEPVTALQPDDRHIAWSRDGTAVYVQRGFGIPARVERVDLGTGVRTLVREVMPDQASVVMVRVIDWIEAGPWFVYNYTTLPSTLFEVTGAIR